jgi:hypothetical protein
MRNPLAAPSRSLRAVRGAAVLVASALASSPAYADPTVDQCVDANTKAQGFRRDGKFGAARLELRICVASTCPNLVRDDCAQRLDELDRAQPTIVFQAEDAAGHDLTAVRVEVDGQTLVDRLDGAAVAVDPGAHMFTFETAGQPPVSQPFVLREGQKARSEHVVMAGAVSAGTGAAPGSAALPAPAATMERPAPSSPLETAADPGRSQRIGGLIVGGVGVAGLVVGAIYAVTAASLWSNAKAKCNPASCPAATRSDAQTDHDNASSAATFATVGFAAGGAFAAAAIALYVTAPSKAHEEHARMAIVPTVGAGVAGAALQGSF